MRDPLIGVAELAERLAGDDPPALLDVRWSLGGPPGVEAYDRGHLAGAVFADLDTDLSGPPGAGGRHPLPTADAFTTAMRRLGVSHGRAVVVYDAGDGQPAARAWWCLTYFGHDDVRVLDGGYGAWLAAGLPVTTASPTPEAGDFTAGAGHLPLLDADGAAVLARTGVLFDVRASERYRGETEPIDPVAGHIPGAVSAPTAANSHGDGGFFEPSVLRERFAGLGATPTEPVGAYCGSGVSAAHAVLALRLAGYDAALYVGSWSDWVSDETRPVATGPQAG
ncbi:MAG: sulfurtransferase [Streptosporangiales bacterium]|nr:sulfurtransferase [Streptosporangiales bacterium]